MPAPIIVKPLPPQLPTAPKTPSSNQPRSFPFPDGKPPGNKGPTDQGDCEEICIWAITQRKNPRKIICQYPGELPIIIEGETFTIENIIPSGGDTFDNWILWDFEATGEAWVNAWFGVFKYGELPVRAGIKSNNSPFSTISFTGKLISVSPNLDFTGGNIASAIGFSYLIDYLDLQGIPRQTAFNATGDVTTTRALFTGNWAQAGKSGAIGRAIWIKTSSPLQDPQGQCIFKIFNISGLPILVLTREICPTVTVIPENCTWEGQTRQLIYKEIIGKYKLSRVEFFTEINENCTKRTFEKGHG